jgi:cytochrome c oxidase cbb3-type subunit III
MNLKNIFQKIILLILSVLAAPAAFAAENVQATYHLPEGEELVLWIAISLVIFLLLVILFILYTMIVFLNYAGKSQPQLLQFNIWENIRKRLTKDVPIENEQEILFDHEYDGIRELDNNLPPWWVYMFYMTIIFGVIYIGYYHYSEKGELQGQEYLTEIKEAEIQTAAFLKTQANSIDENNVKLITDKTILESGKEIFTANCKACHGEIGGGTIGPNLTDEYWLHGGGIKNIFKTIKYGVTDKGMISWKTELTPAQIQQVASYIVSLKGTNPPNAKAPQGDVYKEVVSNE